MMQIALDELREEHLQALLGTVENFRIEFKVDLNLSTPAQRLEAAKDISALANSAGGRIFYGISERKYQDGSRKAERLDRCHYWGPVHVIQILSLPADTRILLEGDRVHFGVLAGGRYEQVVPEVNLAELGHEIEPIARELCDQLFQAAGDISCPFFHKNGSLREDVRAWARLS